MRMKRMSVSKCIPKGNRKRSSNFLFIFTGPFNKSFGQHWLTRTLTFMPIFWHSTIFSQSRTASAFLLFILVWIGIRIAFTQMYAGHVYTGYDADKFEREREKKCRKAKRNANDDIENRDSFFWSIRDVGIRVNADPLKHSAFGRRLETSMIQSMTMESSFTQAYLQHYQL